MTETLDAWRARKRAQALRFTKLDPHLRLDESMDMGTGFTLVHDGRISALVIGRRAGVGASVDLTDDQIETWARQIRGEKPAWTICPECGCQRGGDHSRYCGKGKKPTTARPGG